MGIAGMAMEFRAKREYDSDGEDVMRGKIVGLKGEMAVPVILLTTWSQADNCHRKIILEY